MEDAFGRLYLHLRSVRISVALRVEGLLPTTLCVPLMDSLPEPTGYPVDLRAWARPARVAGAPEQRRARTFEMVRGRAPPWRRRSRPSCRSRCCGPRPTS